MKTDNQNFHFSDFLSYIDQKKRELKQDSISLKEINKENQSNLQNLSSDLFNLTKIGLFQLETLHKYFQQNLQNQIFTKIKEISQKDKITKLGLSFLKSLDIHRPIASDILIPHISKDYWISIKNYIRNLEKFESTLEKLDVFYRKHLDKQIEKELDQVPIKVDDIIKRKYRKQYYKSPLSFQDFLNLQEQKEEDKFSTSRINKDDSPESAEDLRKKFEQALEKRKHEEMKEKQKKSFDNYEEYFEMSERELDRIRRKEKDRRKYKKKSRRRKY